tara:strand:+ start:100 stop:498 length:399 start_codon:yes stop_codon:yes gene_type:complete
MENYNCQYCGTENKFKGYSYVNKYCDNKCQHNYQYQQRVAEWRVTGEIGKGPVKRYLSEQKEGCWECGITDWQGNSIVLELEHIDGNSSNNTEDNLSLLCPNCHSQTDTYKNKNKGNGRHARRQRYAEGKSY